MVRDLTRFAFVGLSCAALACSSASAGGADPTVDLDAGFAAAPPLMLAGAEGKLRIEVRTVPSPPARGTNAIELIVSDVATGSARDGLTLAVVPWMPAMGHGTSVKPTVTPAGSGKYVLTNVSLFMPGMWELRTRFSGDVSDTAVPAFDIQ